MRTLAEDLEARSYRPNRLVWNGKDDDGRLAPDGTYRLKVVLEDEGRSIVYRARSFQLRTDPPRPSVLQVTTPGGDKYYLIDAVDFI